MRRKDLEIALEKVPPFEDPDPSLEQYPTPASIAADIVFSAYAAGDIAGMKVMDLGCGTGMFSIAAALMGAGIVVGYDVSEKALCQARKTAEKFGVDIEFKQSDIRDVSEGADTVLMNPPFGSQKRNADRPFLDKAMECAEKVYSIHMAETLDFVKEYAEEHGRKVLDCRFYKYVIPHTFSFHTKAKQTVEIVSVVIG
jgi:putative methylase